ncbi:MULTISPECIES: RNA polymerase sigma factor [unclassified Pedobacter]|uniref:RNA polymerase sigma factor n=1 Tax=unclassified Pedobacter TaxID=2628915 RepID=UPI001DEF3C39|nr:MULTISPECIES: sigma-70 family RNA polymerase sigma factor [unclassified Pedobacter]CAH0130544.1 ECF RNA polymerase sigma factor SigM [Pedobacter sp. Bi36]CAH0185955.1 ECF RNA polymerase sigma factor SigM [Pedobacter sp. Bi126]
MSKEAYRDLWTSFINGDDGAMKLLYTEFADMLYSFGLRFTTDTELVKDAIQDLFVDLFKYHHTLAVEVNVKSYLFTSLKRKICLVLKKKAAEINQHFEIPFLLSGSAEEQIINDERQSELLGKLSRQLELLPSRQKEALYLRFNSELDYEEISVIMNVSLETCRTLVYRGIKQLRERMVVSHIYKILA